MADRDPGFKNAKKDIEHALRSFPRESGWHNEAYGLDDLDYEEFILELAKHLTDVLFSQGHLRC